MMVQAAPPLPDMIFDESVEILDVQPVVDNVNRTLSIYQADGWFTLPYSEYLTRIYTLGNYTSEVSYPHIAQRPDHTYIFLEPAENNYTYKVWIADPETERMYPIDAPCHTEEFSFYNPWVYVPVGKDTYLCNWITEETSPALPERIGWGFNGYFYGRETDISPDGRYLLLQGPFSNSRGIHSNRLYSYEIETQTFRYMGQAGSMSESIGFGEWLTPTRFVVNASAMPEWSIRNRYVGDVTEVESLIFAIGMIRMQPEIVLDPPGIQAMGSVMLDGPTPGPCYVRFYDAETWRVNVYDTGVLCEYGIPIPDGSGDQLYRATYPSAVVVRYNFFNGTRRNLFTGEVETLGPVSPDGHWGLIALGNSALVDTDQDPDRNFGIQIEPTEYVIMDLNDGTIVGRVPADVQWLTSSYLYNQNRLFTVDDDGVRSSELSSEWLLPLPEKARMLIKTTHNELALYNPTDSSEMIIATIPDIYKVIARKSGDDIIRVTLYDPEDKLPNLSFDVRLP